MTQLLIWVQWRQFLHRRASGRQMLAGIVGTLAGLILVSFITIMAISLGNRHDATQFGSVLATALLLVSVMLLLSVTPQVFEQLFTGRDLDQLFALPIPVQSIFLIRYGEMLLRSGAPFLILIDVPLIGYGMAADLSFLYFPILIIASGSLIACLTAICYLLNLALVRITPAGRSREVMIVLAMLAALIGVIGGHVLASVGSQRNFGEQVETLPRMPGWLPSTWCSTALEEAANGDLASLQVAGGLLFFAVALIMLSLALVQHSFRVGWVQMREHRQRRNAEHLADTMGPQQLVSPMRAIAIKELRMLQRDTREWASLLPLLIFVGYSLVRSLEDRDIAALRSGSLESWLLLQGILVGAFSLAIATFVAPSIAREGPAVWLMRSLPLSGITIAAGKFWVYWGIANSLLLTFETGLAVYLRWSILEILLAIIVLSALTAGIVGIALWAGTFGARYDPDRPNKRLKLGVAFILMALTGLFLLLAMGPLALALLIAETLTTLSDIGALVGFIWLLASSLGTALVMLQLAARRIDDGIQVEIVQSG